MVEGLDDKPYTARYYDGKASEQGLFYGERIELPDDRIAALNASLKDPADCIDPVAVASTKKESKPEAKEPEETSAEEQAAKDAAAPGEAAPAEAPPAKSGH
jgi:hypothetical protein